MQTPSFVRYGKVSTIPFVNAGPIAQTLFEAGPDGGRVYAIDFAQDDTGTNLITLFIGDVLTDNMYASVRPGPYMTEGRRGPFTNLQLTNTTNSTITRSSGSFKGDGWRQYDQVFADYEQSNPQNQVIGYITSAVAEQTLTFTGQIFNAADTTPGAVRLVRVVPVMAINETASAGTANGTVPLVLMSNTNMPYLPTLPDTAIELGPNQLLIAKIATLPAASKNATVKVWAGQK